MNIIRLDVVDGTVINPADQESSYSVKETNRWGAVVSRDRSAIGGLNRSYLPKRDKGRVILVKNLQPGQHVEFAKHIKTYNKNGERRDYRYFLVLEVSEAELVLQQIEKGAIPGTDEPLDVNSNQVSALTTALDQVAKLEEELRVLQGKYGALETVLNRLNRKRKEDKLTVEFVMAELEACNNQGKENNHENLG